MTFSPFILSLHFFFNCCLDEERRTRRANRKYPRSKLQQLIDIVEDNTGRDIGINILNRSLDVSGFRTSKITSRLYELTSLQVLVKNLNSCYSYSYSYSYYNFIVFLRICPKINLGL